MTDSMPDFLLADKAADILISEFQQGTSQLQHNYDRLDKEMQYFLTLLGLAAALTGVLWQIGTVPLAALGFGYLLSVVIVIAGWHLLRQIVHLGAMGEVFRAQILLARKGFVDFDKQIAPYIISSTDSNDKVLRNESPISSGVSG